MEPPPAEPSSPFGPSLLLQGIRIPTLGSFDVVSARIQVGKRSVTIRKPAFRVAPNLGLVHNLTDNQDLRGDKELEPLNYSKVATDAHVSRRQAKRCILGTTSLLSRCLGKGHNVALLLRDVGVLLMEERVVRMRFYPTFLQGIIGKSIHRGDAAKSLPLLGMVVSPVVPIASLTFTGNAIVFPGFELEFGAKPPPRTLLKSLSPPHPLGCIPREDKKKALPPNRQDTDTVASSSFPSPPQREAHRGMEKSGRSSTSILGHYGKRTGAPLMSVSFPVPGMFRDLPLLPSWSSIHTKHKRPWDKKGKDQKMEDQKVKDQKMKDQEVKDQKVEDQKVEDQKMKDQEVKDQKMKDQKMKDQKVKDQKMKDQKVKDQKMKDQEVKDQKMKDQEVKKKKDKCQLKQLPPIPKVSSGQALPSPRVKAQVSKWRAAPAAEPPRSSRPAGLGHKEAPSQRHLGSRSALEPRSPEAGNTGIYKVFIQQDAGPAAAQMLGSRPELFWSVLKEPQKAVLAGYSFRPPLLVPPSHRGSASTPWQPLRSSSVETSME
ncbi:uncharacterized protein PRD47_001029 [Ara ararauna]